MSIPHNFNVLFGLTNTPGTGGVSGNDIDDSSATITVNEAPSMGLSALSSQIKSEGSVASSAYCTIKFERDATAGVRILAKDSGTGGNGDIVNFGVVQKKWTGGNQTIFGSYSNSNNTAYDFDGTTITHIKMKLTTANIFAGGAGGGNTNSSQTYANSYTNDTWLAVNVNDYIELNLLASCGAGFGGTANIRDDHSIEFWARAAGKDDTKLFTLLARTEADVEASG